MEHAQVMASHKPIRAVVSADSEALLRVAVATSLFKPGEAEQLLGGVLRELLDGSLGPGHTARVADGPFAPVGWTYFSPDPHEEGVWELWWIGVVPEYHGHGVGARLLADFEALASQNGARILLICTSSTESTARARAFYVRQGYEQVGQIPEFYGPGDDKVIFWKRITHELV